MNSTMIKLVKGKAAIPLLGGQLWLYSSWQKNIRLVQSSGLLCSFRYR